MEKLKHLEHLEDHLIDSYHGGFKHAFKLLNNVHRSITSKTPDEKTTVTTKYDGSPSILFGTHPENGKFFVATKSAFNKEPKISHTPEDVDKHHGDKPGLASKLKTALEHLPKVTPRGKVFQGDVMHTHDDVISAGSEVHFRPNTITYSAAKNSKIGKRVAESKIGVAVHTEYHGKKFQDLKAQHGYVPLEFGEHKDVHVISPHVDPKKLDTTNTHHFKFTHHLTAAVHAYNPSFDQSAVKTHSDDIRKYINHTVRQGEAPSTDGYKSFYKNARLSHIEGLKLDKNRQAGRESLKATTEYIDKHAKSFDGLFKLHKHIQAAKNSLVDAMDAHPSDFKHSTHEGPAHPEGYVITSGNIPTKFVRRDRFSRQNMNRERK